MIKAVAPCSNPYAPAHSVVLLSVVSLFCDAGLDPKTSNVGNCVYSSLWIFPTGEQDLDCTLWCLVHHLILCSDFSWWNWDLVVLRERVKPRSLAWRPVFIPLICLSRAPGFCVDAWSNLGWLQTRQVPYHYSISQACLRVVTFLGYLEVMSPAIWSGNLHMVVCVEVVGWSVGLGPKLFGPSSEYSKPGYQCYRTR